MLIHCSALEKVQTFIVECQVQAFRTASGANGISRPLLSSSLYSPSSLPLCPYSAHLYTRSTPPKYLPLLVNYSLRGVVKAQQMVLMPGTMYIQHTLYHVARWMDALLLTSSWFGRCLSICLFYDNCFGNPGVAVFRYGNSAQLNTLIISFL